MITVELISGPLDGQRVTVHPKASEYRERIGGERPRATHVRGEGFPLLPLRGAQIAVYRRVEGTDRFEFGWLEGRELGPEHRAGRAL